MVKEMQLVTSREFNGIMLDCYQEAGQADPTDFWATRTQIGRLLGYEDPEDAVKKIHARHKERLDKFARGDKLSLVEGDRTVTREVIVYNFKGLLEICRYSQQPVADAVMDVLWDIADEIRRTGSYGARINRSPKSFTAATEIISKAVRCKTDVERQEVLAMDKVFQEIHGYSVLKVAELKPEVPSKHCSTRSEDLWQHITSLFAPSEWFTTTFLRYSLGECAISDRQLRRHLAAFVRDKKLVVRGNRKSTEYSR